MLIYVLETQLRSRRFAIMRIYVLETQLRSRRFAMFDRYLPTFSLVLLLHFVKISLIVQCVSSFCLSLHSTVKEIVNDSRFEIRTVIVPSKLCLNPNKPAIV